MPNTIPPGTVLNNHVQVIRLLSDKGGFGLVYLGQDRSTGQQVAIKQNRDTAAYSREQFKREADLLIPLSHPNLVKVYGYFEDVQANQFLVMEYIPGEDLWDMADKRAVPFAETEVLQWSITLCEVLTYLHMRAPPIIHRDIKPHNLKIQPTQGGHRIVLIDFGIAKEYLVGQKTQRGARGVTTGFSPLEQYGRGTTPQTDLYALGATMYFLLTLQVPDDAMERAAQNRSLALSVMNPTLSRVAVQAITHAMEIRPEDRFASAAQMSQDLARALQGLGAIAPPISTQPPVPCLRCGSPNRANSRFCKICGAPITSGALPSSVACPNCGKANRGTAKCCAACGRPLVGRMSLPSSPAPVFPLGPIAPSSPGTCPNCGQTNSPGETFCQNCGYQLQSAQSVPFPPSLAPTRPAPAAQSRSMPSVPIAPGTSQRSWAPFPPIAPAQSGGLLPEQTIAGRILAVWGVLATVIGLWLMFLIALPLPGLVFVGLGFLTAIAGRDLTGLFDSYHPDAPGWLQFAFGDADRGRRRGTVLAVLWMGIGVLTAWLIVPLGIVATMAYVLHILISKPLVESLGGHYARPGWVTVIGWLLAFSGIGTVPGIALLIPKVWARQWAITALWLTALTGAIGVLVAFAGLGSTGDLSPLDSTWMIGGLPVKVAALSLLTASLGISFGSFAAVQYMRSAQLTTSTQTAMRRELRVAAWTLFAVGIATILTMPFWAILTDWGTVLFWLGLVLGGAQIGAARDLLELGNDRLRGLPLVVGSMERGRDLGIVASVALAIVAAGLAWGFVSLIFLVVAVFVLRVLFSPQTINLCGGNPRGPAGVTLIAWLLIPTGLGTVPGVLMLNPDAQGWRWARVVLLAYSLLGLVVTLVALANILQMNLEKFPWTVACLGAAFVVCTGMALNYMQSPYVRRYFGV